MRRATVLIAVFAVLLAGATAAFAVEPVLREPGRDVEGLRHVILHASGPLTPADKAELAAKGFFVQRAMSNGRYLARVAEGRTVADARVESIEPLTIEKKISRTALREAGRGKTWAELNVYFHEDVSFDDARNALLAAGAAIDPLSLAFVPPHRIVAKIAPQSLNALAADDRIQAVTGPIRFKVRSDNAKTAALEHVTELFSAPYGLSGAGVTVSLFELARAQGDHPEFGGRFTVRPEVIGGSNKDKSHATHVAGTIGAGGLNPDAKGMAPQAKIFQFCVAASGVNNCNNDFLEDKDVELNELGSVVDNNSWGYILGWDSSDYWIWNDGAQYYGSYELTLTSPIDAISLDRQILFVHSAGNDGDPPRFNEWSQHRHIDNNFDVIRDKLWCYSIDGSGSDCPTSCNGDKDPCEKVKHHTSIPYDTIGMTASGKNTIAVGAVQLVGESVDIASFSSRGPAKDGRVKPDVVARGYTVTSTVPTNAYGPNSGTSMAAPVVTGIAALLVEQWRRVFGADPNPVQLKALIVAGAQDLGRPGPDYTYGFGLVNAKNSADLIIADQGSGKRIRNISVGNAQEVELPFIVDSAQNVRVVLQWGDPSLPFVPGHGDIADKALVNDLDLKIVGPTGTVYLPYVLDKVNYTADATKGVNTVDNTEEIEIKNAVPGAYRIVVNGTSIPEGPQNAVVVSSARSPKPCVDLTENQNNDQNDPYGDLVAGQTVHAGLCGAGDVDFFRFVALPGVAEITFTTEDTAIEVTAEASDPHFAMGIVIEPYSSLTLPFLAFGNPTTFKVDVKAWRTVGLEPFYTMTPEFKTESGTRRRSVR